jgi:hypothetical protein
MLKKLVATSLISGTLVLGGLAPVATAAPVFQGGLVNVAIDVDDVIVAPEVGVQAQVPIGLAANVCNVSVGVLATMIAAPGDTTCDSTVNQRTEAAFDQILRIVNS